MNGASLIQGPISSTSWITIYGTNLSSNTRSWNTSDFIGNRLPTNLDGVSVSVNGKAASVYYISPVQINAQAPTDNNLGMVSVQVSTSQGTATSFATLQADAPAFFPYDAADRKYPAAIHADGTVVGRPDLFGGSLPASPARPGETISLFGTGFGSTSPVVQSGLIFTGAASLADMSMLAVRIGGIPAEVSFAGLVSAGVYQFNVIIPEVEDGDQPLLAEIGSFKSQPNLFVTVQR